MTRPFVFENKEELAKILSHMYLIGYNISFGEFYHGSISKDNDFYMERYRQKIEKIILDKLNIGNNIDEILLSLPDAIKSLD